MFKTCDNLPHPENKFHINIYYHFKFKFSLIILIKWTQCVKPTYKTTDSENNCLIWLLTLNISLL